MKIPVATPDVTEEDIQYVLKCLRSGWISGISPYVEEFESKFAEAMGADYGVAVGSGTTALHLACAALNIEPRDEVVMPAFTMAASANSVLYCQGNPVFVDSDPETWCMDTDKLQEAITYKTKAIMPVHIYGHPCDMGAINDIASDKSLMVIEDAAEAHGAMYKDKKIGSLGHVGCFSLYANKILTTGEGGVITTNIREIAERAKWLRAHAFGRHGKHYWHEEVGYGYRMGGMQAALGTSQLTRLDQYVKNRRDMATIYMDQLEPLREKGWIDFPVEKPWAKNVYWMFSIIVNDEAPICRAMLMRELEKAGIETRTFFYPLHVMPPYETAESFPVAERIGNTGMNLPSGNQLTINQVLEVCDVIKKVMK